MRRIIFIILLMLSHVGYAGSNLYITKKEFYFDQGKCITPVEWQNYMKLDLTIKRDPHNAAQDFFVIVDKQLVPLFYSDDMCDLFIKNPTHAVMKKMIEIASKLKATVQGEDAEIYITPDEIIRR